jgi:flagellar export protein FliJ
MSKIFRFSLDVALQHRTRLEQDAQLALFRIVQGRSALVAEISRLEEDIKRFAKHTDWYNGPVDAASRMNQLVFLDRTAQHIKQRTAQLKMWDEQVQRARCVLRDASARRKALERLRERRKLEYEGLQRQAMDHELDELSTMRYARMADQGGEVDAPLIS